MSDVVSDVVSAGHEGGGGGTRWSEGARRVLGSSTVMAVVRVDVSRTPVAVRGMNAVYGVHALLTLSTVPRTQQRVLADTVDTDGDEPNACVKIHT